MSGTFERRVFWRMSDEGYQVEVVYGIRVAQRVRGQGTRDEAEALARELGAKHKAAEVREEGR